MHRPHFHTPPYLRTKRRMDARSSVTTNSRTSLTVKLVSSNDTLFPLTYSRWPSMVKDRKRGIRWTLTCTLDDLDYTDDIDLLSCRHKDMQETTCKLEERGDGIGLRARNNHAMDASITIQRIPLTQSKTTFISAA